MRDWQRQSYLARERVLKPELFLGTKQHTRYQDKFNLHPAYLSEEPVVVLKEGNVIPSSLTRRQERELHNFARDNDLDEKATMVCYSSLELNNMQVRTQQSEVDIKTCDSIVCGRNYILNDSDDDDAWGEEEIFFGYVRHILKYGTETLVYVAWFRCLSPLGDDQLGGLAVIPVQNRSQKNKSNGWIHVAHLSLQQHLLICDTSDSIFYIVIKI